MIVGIAVQVKCGFRGSCFDTLVMLKSAVVLRYLRLGRLKHQLKAMVR